MPAAENPWKQVETVAMVAGDGGASDDNGDGGGDNSAGVGGGDGYGDGAGDGWLSVFSDL